MKETLQYILLLTLISCNFNKGIKKDLSTGLSSIYNGFSVEDVYLIVDDSILSSNKVSLGKEILLVAKGVENYTSKNGLVFPGCHILLSDNTGKEILNIADAFANLKEGVDITKAKVLTASINTGSPMKIGESYHLKTRFFDKENNANEINCKVTLIMTE